MILVPVCFKVAVAIPAGGSRTSVGSRMPGIFLEVLEGA